MTSLINWLVVCAEWNEINYEKKELQLVKSALLLLLQVPLLEAGDIIIDGGNSEYRDTTVSDRKSLRSSKSLYIIEDVLSVLMCFCHTAAVPESESEGLAVCWQWSQWWRGRGTLWTLTHARRTYRGLVSPHNL